MKGIQRIISGLLAVCMAFSILPMHVFASETEPAAEPIATEIVEQEAPVPVEPVTETVTVQIVPDADLPDNAELFAGFAERELYGYEMATFGTAARAGLNAMEQQIYDVLKAQIETVALNGGSTVFSLSGISGLKTSWTNEELGVTSIDDISVVDAAFSAQFDQSNIMYALLLDCPFDLYWFDKTQGAGVSYGISRSGYYYGDQIIWDSATIEDLVFFFEVSVDYDAGAYHVTSDVQKIATVRNNAAQVVADNASRSDYEKLKAYKEYICDVVSYNHPAADDKSTPYGDPWQLIFVFDGDVTTEVVCEGYAKAFQYLCDLGGLDCISVSGTMTGGTGSGGHMWNVVTLGGKNYLVDVTNCDEGTAGAPDLLFMVGAPYKNGSYSFDCGYQTLTFFCDDLNLETTDYNPEEPPIHVHSYSSVVTAPTCKDQGYTTHICSCGDSYVDNIVDALGHTKVFTPGKAPTCTESGYTDEEICSKCSEVFIPLEYLEALGHTEITVPGKSATCTATGLTESKYCSVCGEVLVAQEVVDSLGHDWSEWSTVDATCTVDGSKTRSCNRSDCNETETDVIPATGEHVYDQEVADAKYLVSEATDTTLAVYRKSCKCGAAGEETFTAGEPVAPEFKDVPGNAYYHDPVMWAVQKKITNGVGDGTVFEPDSGCTRGQIATFLWRAAGCPAPQSNVMPFKDVPTDDYFSTAVIWAAENGITNGTGDGTTFEPHTTCTRGQIVTFLSRYLKGAPSSSENPFRDVPNGAYYTDAVLWAVEKGITNGVGDGTVFEPDSTCTRGMIVTFLYRALN